jgi:isoquinoline 1-oxidoreductase beta subunit
VISRRGFLAGVGAATAGLALARVAQAAGAGTFAPNPWIQIGSDGTIAIVCHRSEMGQGIRSSLPVLVADELGADPAKILVVQGDGDVRYGDQDTDGSSSIRGPYDQLREVAAAAREMLVTAAAQKWHVPAARLDAHDGAVWDGKRSLSFGELAVAASKLPVPKKPVLRKVLPHVGKDLPLHDGPDYVTGRAIYAADVKLPGMLVAVVARPPVLFGKAAKVDSSRALAVPGVRKVVELPQPKAPILMQALGGVAVIADHTWAAMRGRAALDITWDHGANAAYDSQTDDA